MKISVQLYTLRALLEKDLWGTLDKLSSEGFRNVELAGLYGHTPEEFRMGLSERGLKAHSMHVGLDQAKEHLDQTVQEAHTIGLEFVVVPWLDPKSFGGGWKEIAEILGDLAQEYKQNDLKLGYHNHAFEFEQTGGKSGFEVLWENAGPDLHAEVDLYWVKKGGANPVDWLHRLAKQCDQAHFKDMDAEGEFTEVGSGSLDWDAIIRAGKEMGLRYAIIENDQPKIDPLESVAKSRRFLLSKGLTD